MYLSETEAAVLSTTVVGSRPAPTPAARRRLWPLLGPAFVAAVAHVAVPGDRGGQVDDVRGAATRSTVRSHASAVTGRGR